MKVWKQFDADCSGYIEADELKQFIKALLTKRQGTNITEEKLIEYTDTIVRPVREPCLSSAFRIFHSSTSSIQTAMASCNSVK